MTDREFIKEVVALVERAIALEGTSDGKPVKPYLDGGKIPLGDALIEDSFDPLFVEGVRLLEAGILTERILSLHAYAAELRIARLRRSLNLQAQALELLARNASPRLLGTLLEATLRLGAETIV